MRIERILITPEIATQLLTKNIGNRPMSEKHVVFIKNEMDKDLYKETGDTIQISINNKLLDGQHRLEAIRRSGKSYWQNIAYDVPDDAFYVLDTGRPRSNGDILSISGIKNGTLISSAISFIKTLQKEANDFNKSARENAEEKIKFFNDNPEIGEIAIYCNRIYRKTKWISPSILTAIYFVLAKKGHPENIISNFFNMYETGLDLTESSPAYHLRNKLIKDSINKTKYRIVDKVKLFIVCWNLYIKGKIANQNNIRIPDEMPKII
jgi:hypothetical protein